LAIEPGFVLAKNNLGFAEKSRAAEENGLKFVKGRMGEGESADRKRIDLGMVYYREGHYDKAISTWTEIPSGSESYAAAQNNIASALIILKKFDLAKPHIDTALRLKPREPLFQNNRKWLETAKRDSENLAVGTHSTQ
jgi:tetratricopeptide (TPR) repeat protein